MIVSTTWFQCRERVYSTTFSGTVNPISEGGNWTNGLTNGLDWCDVQISSGVACGTQTGTVGPPYNDSTAVLTGSFRANQEIIATVFVSSQDNTVFEEVEMRLRSTISAHVNAGYEVGFRNTSDGTQYCGITRFNGALNDFTTLKNINDGAHGAPAITNGCQVRATIIGTVITYYHRASPSNAWTQIDTYDTAGDSIVWMNGNPGMGFWNRNGSNTNHGFTTWTAREL